MVALDLRNFVGQVEALQADLAKYRQQNETLERENTRLRSEAQSVVDAKAQAAQAAAAQAAAEERAENAEVAYRQLHVTAVKHEAEIARLQGVVDNVHAIEQAEARLGELLGASK